MADNLPTVWPANAHTLAKHAILRRYLQAWFPILTRQAASLTRQRGTSQTREVLFIDGFAGPGEYANGNEGSPIIALKAAVEHPAKFPLPVRMLFIEERPDRFQHLQRVLATYLEAINNSANLRIVDPRPGDCDLVLNGLLDEYEKKGIFLRPRAGFSRSIWIRCSFDESYRTYSAIWTM